MLLPGSGLRAFFAYTPTRAKIADFSVFIRLWTYDINSTAFDALIPQNGRIPGFIHNLQGQLSTGF